MWRNGYYSTQSRPFGLVFNFSIFQRSGLIRAARRGIYRHVDGNRLCRGGGSVIFICGDDVGY